MDARTGRRVHVGLDGEGRFLYPLPRDNDVPRETDERRILWAAGDIVENRPPLSRWHPDYKEAFAKFAKAGNPSTLFEDGAS